MQLGIFADDTKIHSIINSVRDVEELQSNLNCMREWSRSWLLNLNLEKCKVMHIGKFLMQVIVWKFLPLQVALGR